MDSIPIEKLNEYATKYLEMAGLFDISPRQSYFLFIIFFVGIVYLIYWYIYLPIRKRIQFRKFGASSRSPEFICEPYGKCKLDEFSGPLQLDSGEYVFKHQQLIRLNQTAFSYSFLLYMDNSRNWNDMSNIFSLMTINEQKSIFIFKILPQSNRIAAMIGDGNEMTSFNTEINKWIHIVISIDPIKKIVDLFVNGRLEQSQLISQQSADFIKGERDVTLKFYKGFPGKIMKVRYFPSELTPLDVSLLYRYYKYVGILESGSMLVVDGGGGKRCAIETYMNDKNEKTVLDLKKYNDTRYKSRALERLQSDYVKTKIAIKNIL